MQSRIFTPGPVGVKVDLGFEHMVMVRVVNYPVIAMSPWEILQHGQKVLMRPFRVYRISVI